MNLFALCCMADIPIEKINYFLEQTYHNSSKMDCQPSLLLVSSLDELVQANQCEATQPPISPIQSPLIGKSIEDMANSLHSTIKDTSSNAIDPNLFAVLDEQSLSEDTGLVVQVKDGEVDSVCIHFDTINAELIRIQMITFDIKETKGLAGEDGVFRTKPPAESRKGGPAPRKKLA
ncbi:hypothetical protein KCU81_g4920, partial [Aureobasidium melanogenum]|uniref:Uncharacterized protein n=1 Tax=Aureobasidium melanogenum (strain CBS 110374) TaxID=1043003 RepID=A0A074VJR6_AURM1